MNPGRSRCAVVALVLAGCGRGTTPDRAQGPLEPATAVRAVRFVDVTTDSGIDFVNATGSDRGNYFMPAVMAGGAAAFDYDQDDDLDLLLLQAGPIPGSDAAPARHRLYARQPDGRYTDATEAAGLDRASYGMGAAVGDTDNDGDLDVLVAGYGGALFYRNDGDGTFTEAAEQVGLGDRGWATSAAFFDYDRDGFLDLFVARYHDYDPARVCAQEGGRRDFCGPTQFAGVSDLLYHNAGGVRFEDVSERAGITTRRHRGLGVFAADFDDDGWLDVYVANDADPNHLWLNQQDGTFTDDAVLLGAAFNGYGVAQGSMGVAAGDTDEDGDLDLFVTHLAEETNTFYRNLGAAGWEDATGAAGLNSTGAFTGFGTALFDADHDGDLDLAIANGGVKRRGETLAGAGTSFWASYAEPNLLLVNDGAGRFAEVTSNALGGAVEVSRGLLPFDADSDGDLDLLVTNLDATARLYRNDTTTSGGAPGWLELRLVDPRLRREALGAKVTVTTSSGRRLVRHLLPAGGYLTSGHARIHLGLGASAGPSELVVRWPDGLVETFPAVASNRVVTLRRGEGA